MKTRREWKLYDKSTWPDGPWRHEFDRVLWVDAKTKIKCQVIREEGGGLAGFVGVWWGHPWYNQHTDPARAWSFHDDMTWWTGFPADDAPAEGGVDPEEYRDLQTVKAEVRTLAREARRAADERP